MKVLPLRDLTLPATGLATAEALATQVDALTATYAEAIQAAVSAWIGEQIGEAHENLPDWFVPNLLQSAALSGSRSAAVARLVGAATDAGLPPEGVLAWHTWGTLFADCTEPARSARNLNQHRRKCVYTVQTPLRYSESGIASELRQRVISDFTDLSQWLSEVWALFASEGNARREFKQNYRLEWLAFLRDEIHEHVCSSSERDAIEDRPAFSERISEKLTALRASDAKPFPTKFFDASAQTSVPPQHLNDAVGAVEWSLTSDSVSISILLNSPSMTEREFAIGAYLVRLRQLLATDQLNIRVDRTQPARLTLTLPSDTNSESLDRAAAELGKIAEILQHD